MTLSGRDTAITILMAPLKERQMELRDLTDRAAHAETEAERESAKHRLAEIGAAWHGFPGQRRRGDLPRGVNAR